jgi:putative acetyltransferase
MVVDIRPYAPGNSPGIAGLLHRSVRQLARRDYSDVQVRAWAPDEPDLARWRAILATAQTWTAWIDGRLAGFTDLEADGHLYHLYVDPDFERRGVARALCRDVEAAAREMGLHRIHTEASLTALPAFKKFGFQLIAAQTVRVRGQDFVNFRMEKRLVPSPHGLDAAGPGP